MKGAPTSRAFADGGSCRRRRTWPFQCASLAVVIFASLSAVGAHGAVAEYGVVVVRTWPHDPAAFTEGLLWHKGLLYESTGRRGQSSVRAVRPNTGRILKRNDLDAEYFGEGIVIWKDRLIELTWKNQTGFVYDLRTFALRSTFHYRGEGWALTQDGTHLIMSDGTSDLRLLDPDGYSEMGRIHVTCRGNAVRDINELEWVKGEISANIWLSNLIIRIDPATGDIGGIIDLSDLAAAATKVSGENVLNGIAYDAAADRLFVTGKLWPALYQIRLSRRPASANPCLSLPAPRS
jgi:glutaminyl-peptide cyclotransferase